MNLSFGVLTAALPERQDRPLIFKFILKYQGLQSDRL